MTDYLPFLVLGVTTGSIYALALSDAASTARPPSTPPVTPSQPTEGATPATSVTITAIDEAGATAQGQAAPTRSRNDVSTARSAVFRILPDGATDVVWSSSTVTAFAIAPSLQPGSVLIGTADKGRIYSVTNDGRDTLLLQSPEGQISSLLVRNDQVYAASSNQGKLFRFGNELVSEGTFESPVRDAKLTASWGRIWWRGTGTVEVQTRTGNGERPDATWSDWSSAYRNPDGNQISSPRARFIHHRHRPTRLWLHETPFTSRHHRACIATAFFHFAVREFLALSSAPARDL